MTIIELSDVDIEKFKLFMEHYDTFSTLLSAGVFEQKNAAITLNFDLFGKLKNIQRTDTLFRASNPQ